MICCLNPSSLWACASDVPTSIAAWASASCTCRRRRVIGYGPARLAAAARFRSREQQLRLLAPGDVHRDVAATLRLDGCLRSPVVADLRRGVFRRRGQARARDQVDRAPWKAAKRLATAPVPLANRSHRESNELTPPNDQVEIYTDGPARALRSGRLGRAPALGRHGQELYGGEPVTTTTGWS